MLLVPTYFPWSILFQCVPFWLPTSKAFMLFPELFPWLLKPAVSLCTIGKGVLGYPYPSSKQPSICKFPTDLPFRGQNSDAHVLKVWSMDIWRSSINYCHNHLKVICLSTVLTFALTVWKQWGKTCLSMSQAVAPVVLGVLIILLVIIFFTILCFLGEKTWFP